jgi:hypothetical protein
MLDLDAIKTDLIDDAFDTCINDSSYLLYILEQYFGQFNEQDLRKMHSDAFEPEIED